MFNLDVTNPLATSVEAAAMGQLLSGVKNEQWQEIAIPVIFWSILTRHRQTRLPCEQHHSPAPGLHDGHLVPPTPGHAHSWYPLPRISNISTTSDQWKSIRANSDCVISNVRYWAKIIQG